MYKGKIFRVFVIFVIFFLFSLSIQPVISPGRSPLHADGRTCFDLVEGNRKDGIPSIDNPKYLSASEYENSDYFSESGKIIGIVINGHAIAYPVDILNQHEIVNDVIDGIHVSITYCPLTGSGLPFLTSVLNNTSLGTSGFLHENNLIFYDRLTDTFWSQMQNSFWCGISSHDVRTFPNVPVFDTTWETWSKLYPESKILSRDTGFLRDYDRAVYPNYETDPVIYFPTQFNNAVDPYKLYSPKDLTLVIPDFQSTELKTAIFPYEELRKSPVINWDANGKPVVVVYDYNNSLATTFSSELSNGTILKFLENNQIDIRNITNPSDTRLFQDESGTIWNIKGESLAGPLKGETLVNHFSYTAYWFSAITFFGTSEIFLSPNNASDSDFNSESSISNIPTTPRLNSTEGFILGFFGLIVISLKYKKLRSK